MPDAYPRDPGAFPSKLAHITFLCSPNSDRLMLPTENYEVIIGLEVHAQLLTESKMYSNDRNEYGAPPNTQVSVITLGMPGTLPRLNKKAIEFAVKMGHACHCTIRRENAFARKNYFYPDLPKGYQITQHTTPICHDGYLQIKTAEGEKRIGITRIHLEEDAGKSLHDQDPYYTLIDLNRAGTPLIEIVSEPDLRSADEAYSYLTEIRKIVRFLGICDGNMEEGSLRCDANVSVRLKGSTTFGTKVEVKNMNSIRNVKRAIEYEVTRQIEAVEKGEKIEQDTRNFDAMSGTTSSMRSKELANDYRYFPEPDLPPVILSDAFVEDIKMHMPLLPEALKQKLMAEEGLTEYDAALISDDKETARFFEQVKTHATSTKSVVNWIIGPVRNYLHENGIDQKDFPLPPARLAALTNLVEEDKVSFSVASQMIFPELLLHPEEEPAAIAARLNLLQENNLGLLEGYVKESLAKYPEKVLEYKNGKTGLIGLFAGEVKKLSGGRADMKLTNELLRKHLDA